MNKYRDHLQKCVTDSSWRLMQYDSIAINVIVENKKSGINSCDIPYSDDIQKFNENYLRLTSEAAAEWNHLLWRI